MKNRPPEKTVLLLTALAATTALVLGGGPARSRSSVFYIGRLSRQADRVLDWAQAPGR